MKQKRRYRQLEKSTIEKIKQSLTGQTKTEAHKKAISEAMLRYWASVPNKPVELQDKNKSMNPLNEDEK